MKRLLSLVLICLFFTGLAFAEVLNDAQIIRYDHWIYNTLTKLGSEQKKVFFLENSMLSVGELKFYFNQIDEDELSDAGLALYDQASDFLYNKRNLISLVNRNFDEPVLDDSAVQLDMNITLNPEFYYKSNPAIDWTFDYYYKDNPITVPVKFGFANNVAFENQVFIGQSYFGSHLNDSFTNIPIRSEDLEFLFNKYTYGSVGSSYKNWGFNVNLAKQGLRIGNTKMPSVFYSHRFETDGLFQVNLYSNSLKYSGDIIQVSVNKYLYIHQLECIAFNKLKLGIMEGTQVAGPMELRFMNPFIFMHQMSGWNDYLTGLGYDEEKFCAYFGWLFEWSPVENTRIYGIYAQNEIQSKFEREQSKNGNCYPDSYAVQLGAEYSLPTTQGKYWNFTLEGAYVAPYMYVKHTPEASLYRSRLDNLRKDNPDATVNTWIGSPFGPDTISGIFSVEHENPGSWKTELSYLYCVQGTKDFFKTFTDPASKNAQGKYVYYPAEKYNSDNSKYDEAAADANNMWPSGIAEHLHRITLKGEYSLNKYITFGGQGVYSMLFNANHEQNRLEQGIELSISMTYNLF